jgi:hypothetical protein
MGNRTFDINEEIKFPPPWLTIIHIYVSLIWFIVFATQSWTESLRNPGSTREKQ